MMAKLKAISYFVACFILAAHSTDSKHEKRLILHSATDITGEMIKLQQEFAALRKELETQKNTTIMVQKELETQKNTTIMVQKELETQRNTTKMVQKELTKQRNITTTLEQEIEMKLNTMDLEIQKNITTAYQHMLNERSGSVFIRWGRNICPSTASLVYKGFTSGKDNSRQGSGTNNMCLPSDPTWSKYHAGWSSGGTSLIYGTEIDTLDSQHIFNHPVNDQDMPCAVCQSNKSSTLMIPARNNCYSNWTMEYQGYLMAGPDGHQASDFICMDESPEFLQGGGQNNNQHLLYLVEGVCGSLPCPPYADGRELSCVVCSK